MIQILSLVIFRSPLGDIPILAFRAHFHGGRIDLNQPPRLAELDTAREIVPYCRREYCVLSFEAIALLRARGFNVRRLEDGLPEWRADRLPVVTGSA
jgi:rhodanese-related sulfurtransferase